jgi:hypothetical protein
MLTAIGFMPRQRKTIYGLAPNRLLLPTANSHRLRHFDFTQAPRRTPGKLGRSSQIAQDWHGTAELIHSSAPSAA